MVSLIINKTGSIKPNFLPKILYANLLSYLERLIETLFIGV